MRSSYRSMAPTPASPDAPSQLGPNPSGTKSLTQCLKSRHPQFHYFGALKKQSLAATNSSNISSTTHAPNDLETVHHERLGSRDAFRANLVCGSHEGGWRNSRTYSPCVTEAVCTGTGTAQRCASSRTACCKERARHDGDFQINSQVGYVECVCWSSTKITIYTRNIIPAHTGGGRLA